MTVAVVWSEAMESSTGSSIDPAQHWSHRDASNGPPAVAYDDHHLKLEMDIFIIDYFNRMFTLSDGKDIYIAAIVCILSGELNNCFTYVLWVNLAISDHNVLAWI